MNEVRMSWVEAARAVAVQVVAGTAFLWVAVEALGLPFWAGLLVANAGILLALRFPRRGWRLRAREIEALLRLARVRSGEEVLDAACGAGAIARRMHTLGARVFGADPSGSALARARTWLCGATRGDLETLRLGRRFDAVVSGSLAAARDPRVALAALARHVRPGGRVVVLVPARLASLRALRDAGAEHGLRLVARARPSLRARVVSFRAER